MKTHWVSVNIDMRTVERIKKILQHYSYKSVADYVADAVRRRLEHHELEVDIKMQKLERLAEMEE